ncbi:MAG: AIR synthase related protein [Actinomycetota bacterium]
MAGALLALLDHPAVGDPSWIYQQYDHMLFLNTVVGPGHDGTLLRVKGTDKGLAVSVDGNGRRSFLDPRRGAARLVYEAALNVALAGARPLAVVDNLNFGNPERPEVMWQLAETIEGIAEACEALGLPVVGGNVSFYNETDGRDIHPSPVIGLLGLADPMPKRPPRLDRGEEGMELWLFGPEPQGDFAGSRYAQVVLGHRGGRPAPPDPEAARAAIALALELAGVAPVLHDLSDGGLAVALAEVCISSQVGAHIEVEDRQVLFDETPHRLLAAFPAGGGPTGFPGRRIGRLWGDRLDLGGWGSVSIEDITRTWRQAIPRRMD